ncbi:MAG: nucleotide exchange factor GrpE [Muribaculaceae bacterium]|nr:nucleotide exchange factor GrpE [Muribaculaceae bacterium]
MSKHKHNNPENTPNTDTDQAKVEDILDTESQNAETEAELNAEVSAEQALQQELDKTRAELEKEKKEYLFLMADFDNYRKRQLKERADLIKNAAEKTLLGILPIVDDFERGLEATKNSEDAAAVRQGMELIYQKLVKYLADNGVKAMETPAGADFDADFQEAVATIPAPEESLKGKIIDTTQKGYTLNGDKVLRHAKVVVGE